MDKNYTDVDASRFHEAVEKCDLAGIDSMLRDNPVLISSVNPWGSFGYTPLHLTAKDEIGRPETVMAARDRKMLVAKLLVVSGADVNARARDRYTPLHLAARAANKEMVELLLANGAQINATDDLGCTPIYTAVGVSPPSFASDAEISELYRRKEEVVRFLLANGADPSIRTNRGHGCLEMVGDHWEVGELLLPNEAAAATLRCEKCRAVYTIGVDAVSMTSLELSRMMPGLVGKISTGSSPDLMIGRTRSPDKGQIRKDRVIILCKGPEKGWTCQSCHHDNQWRLLPAALTEAKSANSWVRRLLRR